MRDKEADANDACSAFAAAAGILHHGGTRERSSALCGQRLRGFTKLPFSVQAFDLGWMETNLESVLTEKAAPRWNMLSSVCFA